MKEIIEGPLSFHLLVSKGFRFMEIVAKVKDFLQEWQHQATNQRQLYERMAQSIASMPISPRHLLGICYFVLEKLPMPHGGADLVHFV